MILFQGVCVRERLERCCNVIKEMFSLYFVHAVLCLYEA